MAGYRLMGRALRGKNWKGKTMLSDDKRKAIEQAIDGKATTRDGRPSKWIHAGAAEDIAKRVYPLIEQWISEAVDVAVWDALEADPSSATASPTKVSTVTAGELEYGGLPEGYSRVTEYRWRVPGSFRWAGPGPANDSLTSVEKYRPQDAEIEQHIVVTGPWGKVEQ